MRVDRGITSSTRQVLILLIWDVEMGLWVTVLLGQTKVDKINLVATPADAHKEVVWLEITVDEGLHVNVFNARDELICEKKNCF